VAETSHDPVRRQAPDQAAERARGQQDAEAYLAETQRPKIKRWL
jgi:hypothetical protein